MEPVIDFSKNKIVENFAPVKKSGYKKIIIIFLLLGFFITATLYFLIFIPNPKFNKSVIIKVGQGETVKTISKKLRDNNIIISDTAFSLSVKLLNVGTKLQQGDYLFSDKESVYQIINRISNADYGIDEEKILIREGLTNKEISDIFKEKLPAFSADSFLDNVKDLEGYLFPDTYIFLKTATSGQVSEDLKNNFTKKTQNLKIQAEQKKMKWNEVLIVASLVELEGKTSEDRKMIADIIYRRLEKNMPLQLDAPFQYYLNKASLELTQDDLFTESPYNTYRNKGLPPTPICNVGVESIDAAINPTPNDYIYYLSDKEGVIHYAKNFEEHKKNKSQYLK